MAEYDDPEQWIDGSRGTPKSSEDRRAEVRARLEAFPPETRMPWIKKDKFEAAGRPYKEWFGWDREDIWPELLDSDGIPIPTRYTGCKIGQANISTKDNSAFKPGEGRRITPGFRATMKEPIPTVQCTFIKPGGGERCGRWSMKGLSVCYVHGGKTKIAQDQAAAVIDAARMRLFGLAEDAVSVLEGFVKNTGAPDAVRLKAATELLDRVGIRGGVEFDVAVEHKLDPSLAVMDNLSRLSENQRKGIEAKKKLMKHLAEDEDDNIEDAEIVIEVDEE